MQSKLIDTNTISNANISNFLRYCIPPSSYPFHNKHLTFHLSWVIHPNLFQLSVIPTFSHLSFSHQILFPVPLIHSIVLQMSKSLLCLYFYLYIYAKFSKRHATVLSPVSTYSFSLLLNSFSRIVLITLSFLMNNNYSESRAYMGRVRNFFEVLGPLYVGRKVNVTIRTLLCAVQQV